MIPRTAEKTPGPYFGSMSYSQSGGQCKSEDADPVDSKSTYWTPYAYQGIATIVASPQQYISRAREMNRDTCSFTVVFGNGMQLNNEAGLALTSGKNLHSDLSI